jgi:hypothetical protein
MAMVPDKECKMPTLIVSAACAALKGNNPLNSKALAANIVFSKGRRFMQGSWIVVLDCGEAFVASIDAFHYPCQSTEELDMPDTNRLTEQKSNLAVPSFSALARHAKPWGTILGRMILTRRGLL